MKEYASELALDQFVIFTLGFHKGRENAIKRWDLVAQVFGEDAVADSVRNNNNPWDRAVRDSIERWRSQGQHICSQGGGYYLAKTREEYDSWVESYVKPARRLYSNKAMMDETADRQWGKKPQADPLPMFSAERFQ